ncbi:TPA: hypothetical protein DIV49_02460 [Candidatus Saccharibacteria bacterium]|nr:hypothetical protein [Candidatus Saccharibacteria bacterium]HRJ90879.1 hypothetical protein [Candidatus Saccharibacteria bacterium]
MRKNIIVASLVGWAIIFGITSGTFSGLMMFLLVGIVPGTDTVLSPMQMGALLSLIASLSIIIVLSKRSKTSLEQRYSALRERLPKRRFHRI